MASSKIVDLRKLLADRFVKQPPAPASVLPTGISALDEQIAGGLPKGGITEITSPHASSGSATLLTALLHQAYRERYFVAVIDARDSFDPQLMGKPILQHLLWMRCHSARDAVRCSDLLLRDGNFPLLVLDLILNASSELASIPQTTWYRLQRLVENIPTAFLVLTRQSMVASAQLKLILQNRWELQDLEREQSLERLAFSVRRSHLGASDLRQQLVS